VSLPSTASRSRHHGGLLPGHMYSVDPQLSSKAQPVLAPNSVQLAQLATPLLPNSNEKIPRCLAYLKPPCDRELREVTLLIIVVGHISPKRVK